MTNRSSPGTERPVGTILMIHLPGGIDRRGKILGYCRQDEMVRVAWIDYALPNEWIPTRHLP